VLVYISVTYTIPKYLSYAPPPIIPTTTTITEISTPTKATIEIVFGAGFTITTDTGPVLITKALIAGTILDFINLTSNIIIYDSNDNEYTIFNPKITKSTDITAYIEFTAEISLGYSIRLGFPYNMITLGLDTETKGGAVYIQNGTHNFEKCIFSNNFGRFCVHGYGGAVYSNLSDTTFSNCGFIENSGVSTKVYFSGISVGDVEGGAIYSSESNLSLVNCIFHSNSAIKGGAIYFSNQSRQTDLTVTNCTLTENSAINYINKYFTNSNTSSHGGGIYILTLTASNINIANSILIDNIDGTLSEGNIYAENMSTADINIHNCINGRKYDSSYYFNYPTRINSWLFVGDQPLFQQSHLYSCIPNYSNPHVIRYIVNKADKGKYNATYPKTDYYKNPRFIWGPTTLDVGAVQRVAYKRC